MLVTFNAKAKERENGKKIDKSTKEGKRGIVSSKAKVGKVKKAEVEPRAEVKEEKAVNIEKGSIRIIEDARDFHRHKASRRSKKGCLTCKIRKKKCDEIRPTCTDCDRLNKECVWVDYDTMSEEQIKELRERVENEESVLKLRKRKSRTKSQQDVDTSSTSPADTSATSASYTQKLKDSYAEISKFQFNDFERKRQKPVNFFLVFNSSPSQVSEERNITSHQPFATPNSPNIESLMNPLVDIKKDLNNEANDLALNELESYGKIAQSPIAFLNFLKGVHQTPNNGTHDEKDQAVTLYGENTQYYRTNEDGLVLSPNFSIPSMLENLSNEKVLSPSDFNTFASSLNSIFSPIPHTVPSIIPELSGKSAYLYNYYVETLSRKVCIAPSSQNESNSYQNIFLPLAHQDKGVLYAILAWSGFHLDGDWIEEGKRCADLALEHMNKTLKESMVNSQGKDDRQSILVKLATLLILCGAEICRGDVKNWSVYLYWGWNILFTNGGILNFNLTKEEHWLISNFAYHDLLASSSSERGTYFPLNDYEVIFSDSKGLSRGNLNPLLGVSKKLYRIIGDISTLAFESKIILNQYYKRNRESMKSPAKESGITESPIFGSPTEMGDDDSDISTHARMNHLLSSVIGKAKALEEEIDESKPDLKDLENLNDDELEWQLTLFEAFQISAKLFLRQSIMKCNPSSLESQVLANDLIKCIDIILGSPVQASLVFPMFMSGIHCVTSYDRAIMKQRLDEFMNLYGPWNVIRAKFLMERVWEQNPFGDQVVDWHSILKDLGWDINFA